MKCNKFNSIYIQYKNYFNYFSSQKLVIKEHEEFLQSIDFFCSKLLTISNILIIKDRLRDIVYLNTVLLNNTINQKYLVTEENAWDHLKKHFEKLKTEIEFTIRKQLRLVGHFKIMSSIRGNPCQNVDSEKVKQLCPPPESSSSSIHIDSDYSIDISDKISINSLNMNNFNDTECYFVSPPLTTRMDSIYHLKTDVANLDDQVDQLNKEKECLSLEISNKKKKLLNAINEVIKLELSIREVEKVIADKLYHFQSRIIDLENNRLEEFKNNEQNQLSSLLEQEIDDVKRQFQTQSKLDEINKNQLIQNAQNFAASLGDVVAEYKENEDSFNDHNTFDENMNILKHLLSRPGQFCHDENNARFYLNVKKEKVYQLNLHSSQCILDDNGNRLRIQDGFRLMDNEKGEYYEDIRERNIYVKYFFKDSFGQYYVDINGNRCYKGDPEASEYMLVNGQWVKTKEGTYEKDDRGQRIKDISEEEIEIGVEQFDITTEEGRKAQLKSNDLNYIKESVGPAIKKALAAIVIHQPMDPISYFANYLLQYRYNQQMFESREQELLSYLQQRKEIQDKENKYCCPDRKISKLN